MEKMEVDEPRGPKPQKESPYNKLLPYADKLEDESRQLYLDIKTNLVKSFLAREMRPGFIVWTSRLHKYIKIYGYKFSKEDHICLIKMYYTVVVLPSLEPPRIGKFTSMLTLLLKKVYLLSRDDLELPWRPLYEMVLSLTKNKKLSSGSGGSFRYMSSLEGNIETSVKLAALYFPTSATQEILDEFRPLLYPYRANDFGRGINYLEWFLPLLLKPSESHLGYELWFKEFMNLWEICHNSNMWENHMMLLMTNLCNNNIGYIDWEPYVPIMFSRFLRALQLPVGYKQKQSSKFHKIDITAMAQWVVSALGGPKDTVFVHLDQFMQILESYFHTANSGRWSPRIREFLKKISLHFVTRIYKERHMEPSWISLPPENHRLTDEDIDRFVNILKPCVEHIVYCQSQDTVFTFNYLASIRPNIIIPILLDKLYMSMDSLTEPHKLTSAMLSVSAVARYMVQGERKNYPEGPTHVIPILMNLLPGIDANDIGKCYMTFNLILQFIIVMPLINSSEASLYYDDLTEEEHIVCESTAQFEDFVVQFFDRLCTWVESNSVVTTRMEQNDDDRAKSRAENQAEGVLVTVIYYVLMQCSPEIYMVALKKMYNFATSHIFEVRVSGKMMSGICQSFGRVNPHETAKLFIPHLCDTLDTLLSSEDVLKEETLDEELLYYLLLLSDVVDVSSELVNYIDRLMKILDKALFLASLQGSMIASQMLRMIITTLSFIQPIEMRSSGKPYDLPLKENLSVREWGMPYMLEDLTVKWYEPGEKEVECLQMLMNHYLAPQLKVLNDYASGEIMLSRDKLRQVFRIILSILSCNMFLPMWDEPSVNVLESTLDEWSFDIYVGDKKGSISMPDGSNVRKAIADTMHRVQQKIMEVDEGDTKSVFYIINIYESLLFCLKVRGRELEYHWKNFHTSKAIIEDKLLRHKGHLRHMLIDRLLLQHEIRNASRFNVFTSTHRQIFFDLFELSISHYSQTRSCAQSKLLSATSKFPYCYTILKQRILDTLKLDSVEHHDKIKGCLFLLLGPKQSPFIAKQDWYFIRDLWPALLASKPSEKLSIVHLVDTLIEAVHNYFPTISIQLNFPTDYLEPVHALCKSEPEILINIETHALEGLERLNMKNKERLDLYNDMTSDILEILNSGTLHWRYFRMGVAFLRDLIHPEVNYNPDIVRFFLKCIVHDSLQIRKMGTNILVHIFSQNKRKFAKKVIEIEKNNSVVKPGVRPDNKWLLYNSSTVPKTAEEWNKPRYIHTAYLGFYCWPKVVEVYDDEHSRLDMDALNPQQMEIYNFFHDDNNMKMLIKFNSMEEKKGHDKLNGYRFLIFKNVFKLFEDKLLPVFLPYLEELVKDKQEQSQRCAAEIISGIISGAKHWSFEQTENLWKILLPMLRTALSNLADETLQDWATAFSSCLENRDPNRYHWFLEFLIDNPINEQTAYLGGARIYILQCALNQQIWRNLELLNRMLEYFKNHLKHPFQSIRDRISMGLTNIFCKDPFSNGNSPNARDFFQYVMPQLMLLYKHSLQNLTIASATNDGVICEENNANSDINKEESIKLFKIVAKYATNSVSRTNFQAVPESYNLLPLASVLQSNDIDEELVVVCTNLIVMFGNALVLEKNVPTALAAINDVSQCPFWSARFVIAEFMPSFVFHNMHTLISNREWVNNVITISLKLLEDVNPDVREKACDIISGFLHCNFIPEPMNLLETFKLKARTKLRKNEKKIHSNGMISRHAGVLGLCSYIKSHPYDVPDFMPSLFEILGVHLNDPQPIPAAIRKTLGDFKRTHHSNWEHHKLKFTENELLVLSDLTVPPSYYA